MEASIVAALTVAFAPVTHLTVFNESHMHSVPAHSETHFRVVLAAPALAALPRRVDRHRAVTKVLAPQLKGGVHALSLQLFSDAEWAEYVQSEEGAQRGADGLPGSPNCRGGFGL